MCLDLGAGWMRLFGFNRCDGELVWVKALPVSKGPMRQSR